MSNLHHGIHQNPLIIFMILIFPVCFIPPRPHSSPPLMSYRCYLYSIVLFLVYQKTWRKSVFVLKMPKCLLVSLSMRATCIVIPLINFDSLRILHISNNINKRVNNSISMHNVDIQPKSQNVFNIKGNQRRRWQNHVSPKWWNLIFGNVASPCCCFFPAWCKAISKAWKCSLHISPVYNWLNDKLIPSGAWNLPSHWSLDCLVSFLIWIFFFIFRLRHSFCLIFFNFSACSLGAHEFFVELMETECQRWRKCLWNLRL